MEQKGIFTMKAKTEEDKMNIAQDVQYFKSLDNYCLGKTLKEAGDTCKRIIAERNKELENETQS